MASEWQDWNVITNGCRASVVGLFLFPTKLMLKLNPQCSSDGRWHIMGGVYAMRALLM
jgi:hypothetical protein